MPSKPKMLDWAAEVTLVSQDGEKFKIKKYHLLSGSSFFRDLFEQPNTLTGSTTKDNSDDTAIELDLKSDALRLLVDLLHKGEVNRDLPWKVYRDVLLACDKYDMEVAAERTLVRFKRHVKQAPWEIFCFASKTDNLSLAKAALEMMQGDDLVGMREIDNLPLEAINDCTLSYYAGLVATIKTVSPVRCSKPLGTPGATKTMNRYGSVSQSTESVIAANWVKVAERFDPVRPAAGKKRKLTE